MEPEVTPEVETPVEPETTGFAPAPIEVEKVSVLRCDKCQKETGSPETVCSECKSN